MRVSVSAEKNKDSLKVLRHLTGIPPDNSYRSDMHITIGSHSFNRDRANNSSNVISPRIFFGEKNFFTFGYDALEHHTLEDLIKTAKVVDVPYSINRLKHANSKDQFKKKVDEFNPSAFENFNFNSHITVWGGSINVKIDQYDSVETNKVIKIVNRIGAEMLGYDLKLELGVIIDGVLRDLKWEVIVYPQVSGYIKVRIDDSKSIITSTSLDVTKLSNRKFYIPSP